MNIIQAQYDDLEEVADRFDRQLAAIEQLLHQVTCCLDDLEHGGWSGRSARTFFRDMEDETLPAVRRLIVALEMGSDDTRHIARLLAEAEEEAASVFRGDGGPVGWIAPAPGLPPGGWQSGGDTGWVAPAPGQPPGWVAPAPGLPPGQWRFDPDSILQSRLEPIAKEDKDKLGRAMQVLMTNPTGSRLDRALNDLATIRGLTPAQARQQYNVYQQLVLDRQARIDSGQVGPVGRLVRLEHWASNQQLRFGKVVGDTFNIDPAFGAMLSPTGGLVGPGNGWGLHDTLYVNDGALAYHGVFHDGGGYLYNYHNVGPGYNYLHFSAFDTSSAVSGQTSGITYWANRLNTRTIYAPAEFRFDIAGTNVAIKPGVKIATSPTGTLFIPFMNWISPVISVQGSR